MVHAWHICDDKGLVFLGQFEVVCCTGRSPNDLVKAEPSTLPARLGHYDVAPPHLVCRFVWRVVVEVAQESKPALCMRLRAGVERVVVHAGRRAGNFAVVGLAVEVQDGQSALEEVDAGDEGFALNAVLVQIVRVPVACRDDDSAVRHECFHQAAQDHGVGNIGALELVEAEDRGALGDVGGDIGD